MSSERLLVLLNPGRQSRHYLLGIAGAAARTGRLGQTLELGPIWQATGGPDRAGALAAARGQVANLVRRHRVTHVLGYVFNGTHDLGLTRGPGGATQTLWDELGIRHILLWTDHPEWAMQGCAIDAPLRDWLGGPGREHVVKSAAAAMEASAILGWANVRWSDMAEDPAAVAPRAGIESIHDAVAIVGDAAAPPGPTLPMLAFDDPDPAEIDSLMRPHAERAWRRLVGEGHGALLSAWLDLKQQRIADSFWRIAADLERDHRPSLAWLRADARRWYTAVQSLRRMVGWRRNFWLAWLGRRVDLGVYGSSAAAMGIAQTEEAARWVPYERQAAVYARGRAAININASHDEEGLTHKPFQIGASGVACIHHEAAGLERCFAPGHEVMIFSRGPRLLEAVRSLAGDEARRRAIGGAALARTNAEHRWDNRLEGLLGGGAAGLPTIATAA